MSEKNIISFMKQMNSGDAILRYVDGAPVDLEVDSLLDAESSSSLDDAVQRLLPAADNDNPVVPVSDIIVFDTSLVINEGLAEAPRVYAYKADDERLDPNNRDQIEVCIGGETASVRPDWFLGVVLSDTIKEQRHIERWYRPVAFWGGQIVLHREGTIYTPATRDDRRAIQAITDKLRSVFPGGLPV